MHGRTCEPCPPPLQVTLSTDFVFNKNSREATASFGYDYILRQARLRGRIDTGACVHGVGQGGSWEGAVTRPALQPCRAKPGKHALPGSGTPPAGRLEISDPHSWNCAPSHALDPLLSPDGKIGAYVEERLSVGINFVLSAELDHVKKDYKFGFGLNVGE